MPTTRSLEDLETGVLEELDVMPEIGIRGYRAIALMSVMAKWYAAVLTQMLREIGELGEWRMVES